MVGFPVPNPTTPYWTATPHPLANYRSSETLPAECDIAIIGTGMAGVATAYHFLTDPSLIAHKPKVVLFEARQACSGATGRNGGHSKCGSPGAMGLWNTFGPDGAAQLMAHVTAQREAIKTVVEKEGIDCDLLVRRSYDVFFNKEQARTIRDWLRAAQKAGAPWAKDYQWLDGPNLERVTFGKITGVNGIHGAVNVPVVSFWPYKFVTALLSRVVELGGLLYTETVVKSVVEQDNPSTSLLTTSRGTIRAQKVVFATNGYASALLPQYNNVITPYKGQNSHLVAQHGDVLNLAATYNLYWDGKEADYMAPQPDGTIVLGGGQIHYRPQRSLWYNTVDDTTLISDQATAHFNGVMRGHFRGWAASGAAADYVWTGIQGATADALPHVGRVPGSKTQLILAGFNGGGMALIFTLARDIGKMVAREGVEYEDTDMPPLMKTTKERLKQAMPEK